MIKPSDASFLPESAGCYLFHNKLHQVIYVGKAKNLRKRVSSYFQKKDHDPKTLQLLTHINTIDIIVTPTEVDALLLESSLIKKYYPPFNIDLKDSRKYAYLLLHPGPLPWVEVARSRDEKGEYYGPFVSGAIRNLIMDVLRRNFRVFTRKPSPRLKKATDPQMYAVRVAQAREILKGNTEELIEQLEKQMQTSAQKTYYEYALTLRNQINALKTLKHKQMIEMTRTVDAHIFNYQVIGDTVYLLIFSIRKGVLEEKQEYSFEYRAGFLDEFLVQYYDQAPIPQEVIVPVEVDPALAQYLTKKSGRKVTTILPQKGDKKDLLDFVAHNVSTTFFAGSEGVQELQKILQLEKSPRYIECFDISHLGGTNTVASMTAFTNGLPDKANYRRFKIQTAQDGDDYLAMKEVVQRRYTGSLAKTMKKPDLIVIDGGKGQLHAAVRVLKEARLAIPVIALAKEFEEIHVPDKGDPLRIDRKNKGLQVLQAIRDEAHRFALTYQRLLRAKGIRGENLYTS